MNKTMTLQIKPDDARRRVAPPTLAPAFDPGCAAEMAPRWKKILVPVDFSLESMKALAYASKLAEALGASLCLMHVLAAPALLAGIRRNPVRIPKQALVDQARAKLLAVARRKVRSGVPATISVRIGEPDREILAAAARLEADALVLHTKAKRGLESFLCMGVTRRTAYGASCPVLFLPTQVLWQAEHSLPLVRPASWRRLLIPLAMSAPGAETLAHGLAVAGWFKASATAFNVIRSGLLRDTCRTARARSQDLTAAKTKFEAWVRRRTPCGLDVEAYVGAGKTAPTFLQAARQMKAHLIVMGIQQFSGWRRLHAARAISRILGETPCPILSVPQPPGAGPARAAA